MTDLRRAPAAFHATRALPNRGVGAGRPRRRRDVAVEVGKTMLILVLLGAAIVALRCILAAIHGALG